MKRIYITLVFLLVTIIAKAQDKVEKKTTDTATRHNKHSVSINIGNGGVRVTSTVKSGDSVIKTPEKQSRFSSHFLLLDLGFNFIQDNTNYNSAGAQKMLEGVDPNKRNSSLFDLRTAKSINVNLWPWLEEYKALKTPHQQINIITGIGLQFYNFRYDNNITFTKKPSIITDDVSFSKNKVGLDYLTVPLMIDFKTKIFNKKWLVYGIGVTEGARIASWTKQVSSQRGKVKVHDEFDFQDFNTCLTGEIGIEGVLRLYASYQVTSLYKDGLDQHPICVGVRILGI